MLKASAAIREGGRGRRQCRYMYFDFSHGDIACCALGAAGVGAGVPAPTPFEEFNNDRFYAATKAVLSDLNGATVAPILLPDGYPQKDEFTYDLPLAGAIATINDMMGWSFEQIADWLESIGH